MIDSKTELLDHCQVPAHSVQTVDVETCTREEKVDTKKQLVNMRERV